LFLGAIFISTGTIWCLILAWSASAIRGRLTTGTSVGTLIRQATGALFVGLGVRLAVSK
jgi:threonine/homoserine/homoserine lactone efflux protein